MRILHTSDWHIGRTFHGHPTLETLEGVLGALADIVVTRHVDVIAVAGDVFDSAAPSADAYRLLNRVLRRLRATGAVIVVTSGNHDSAARLGFQAEFAALAGIHVLTRDEALAEPVTVEDSHGPVYFYGIPYLEPALIRHRYPDATLRTQADAIGFAMDRIRADLAARRDPEGNTGSLASAEPGGRPCRSVVLSHCFTAGVAASDVERDISAGGLDLVPSAAFEGVDYAALGHIHGRATLAEGIRYSGAPLHYSFSEASSPRGAWLVDLDAGGLSDVDWVDLPVPRTLSILTDTLENLLTDSAYTAFEDDWVSAVLTDTMRPIDGMRKLQRRFAHCAALDWKPDVVADHGTHSYAERIQRRSDTEIIGGFLEFVRNGEGPSEAESALVADAIAEVSGAADDVVPAGVAHAATIREDQNA